MHRKWQVLICDDDLVYHHALKLSLKCEFSCTSVFNGDEALAVIRNRSFDILLLDIKMRSSHEGLLLIPKVLNIDPDISIVMCSGNTDFRVVNEALKTGATDFVAKDSRPEELLHCIHRVIERKTLIRQKQQQDFESNHLQKQHVLIGKSPVIQSLRKTISKVAPSSLNVVITGETGTGKELVARQLRRVRSDQTLAPFISIDSATIQSSTAESTLFGHEKGAFTGADKTTKGIFEEAHGGDVYFDEISNMPLNIQAKLLRVLQEKEVVRLGSSKVIPLDFRTLCATNQDLESLVKQGLFKEDLLQRLNVIPISVPPLRERREDIPMLIDHFIQKHSPSSSGSSPCYRFTSSVIDVLQRYDWPGNIRELSNLVAYLVTMTESDEIKYEDLPPKYRQHIKDASARFHGAQRKQSSFYQRMAEFEGNLLLEEYRQHQGNISQLALRLDMDRSHLYAKLKEFGIHLSRR